MVLTYDAYTETLENQKQKEDDIAVLKNQVNKLMTVFKLAVNAGEITASPSRKDLAKYSVYDKN